MSLLHIGCGLVVAMVAVTSGSCDGTPASPEAPKSTCFEMPQTHLEIINSCDTGTSYEKAASLPKFQQGAVLMPLP